MTVSWILTVLAAALLVALLAVIVIMRIKGIKQTPNFRSLFVIGIAIMVVGIPETNYPLMGLGLLYMIIGFVNRKKWKDKPRWSDLPPAQKKFKLVVVIALAVLVAAEIVTYFLYR